MAKTMALLSNNVVINLLWCNDDTDETATLKNVNDKMIEIGDVYDRGKFYRSEKEVLDPYEEEMKKIAEYKVAIEIANAELEDMREALNVMGVST